VYRLALFWGTCCCFNSINTHSVYILIMLMLFCTNTPPRQEFARCLLPMDQKSGESLKFDLI
jgi:hypothetical protein